MTSAKRQFVQCDLHELRLEWTLHMAKMQQRLNEGLGDMSHTSSWHGQLCY